MVSTVRPKARATPSEADAEVGEGGGQDGAAAAAEHEPEGSDELGREAMDEGHGADPCVVLAGSLRRRDGGALLGTTERGRGGGAPQALLLGAWRRVRPRLFHHEGHEGHEAALKTAEGAAMLRPVDLWRTSLVVLCVLRGPWGSDRWRLASRKIEFGGAWRRLGDSNTRPTHYECAALPAELRRPGLRGVSSISERDGRPVPAPGPIGPIQPPSTPRHQEAEDGRGACALSELLVCFVCLVVQSCGAEPPPQGGITAFRRLGC